MQVLLNREERGKMIAEKPNQIRCIRERFYRVVSQSGRGMYDVRKARMNETIGWICTCPDFVYRQVKCKHIWAVEFSAKLRELVKPRVIEPIDVHICIYCKSDRLIKWGIRHNKYGDIQKFSCKSCGRYFTINLGFERMKHSPQGITAAMQLYFSGESLRNTAKSLRLIGVEVRHKTVYCWIRKYVEIMGKYLNQIKPQVSDTWRADEMWLKIKGNPKYLYALLDDETRYWIAKEVAGDKFSREAPEYASRLFQQGKEVAGKKPLTLITDGLHAYHLAYKREFYAHRKPVTKHVEHIAWQKDKGNQKMEAFNGTVRSREKVMRSLKREDSPILDGYRIFHNHMRPHMALDGKTPAEACGIEVKGNNKWLTIIQKASSDRRNQQERRN
ncbi:MAG: DDE-type integrase/transposase/recombinase [Candidatus Bathyarchaeia archaeon]